MDATDNIPIHAFLGLTPGTLNPDPEFLMLLREAEVVIGCDVMTGWRFLAHGKSELKRAARANALIRSLYVELDVCEVEVCDLLRLIHQVKGTCDDASVERRDRQ